MQRTPSWKTDRRSSSERGYGWKWRKFREGFLREHPLCRMCHDEGKVVIATVVDHIVPHRGDQKLFWSEDNLQALCAPHHDSDKQMLEKSGEQRTKFDPTGRVVW